jgi:hypothetical protein
MRHTLAVLILMSASGAHAGNLLLDINPDNSHTGAAGPSSVGWQFTVNTPFWVDGLTFWGTAEAFNHDVAIYDDNTQAQVASATVLTTDPLIGQWRVHAITPVLLGPGTYDIQAEVGNDPYTEDPFSLFTSSWITYVQEAYTFGSGTVTFPTQFGTADVAWFGPNFTAITPEPATLALMGAGLLALALRRRAARTR